MSTPRKTSGTAACSRLDMVGKWVSLMSPMRMVREVVDWLIG
jgi:hypothetical protein